MREGWQYAIEGAIAATYYIFGIKASVPDCEHLATEIDDISHAWTKDSRWARIALYACGLVGRALDEIGHEAGSDEELELDDDGYELDSGSFDSAEVIDHEEE